MGDRGNIAVIQSGTRKDSQVWLYSHWSGTELPEALQEALKAYPDRWRDDTYLTRIIFCRMVKQESWGKETGFGIGTSITDNEHTILVVDTPTQTVWLIEEDQLTDGRIPDGFKPEKTWTFQEFADLATLPEI